MTQTHDDNAPSGATDDTPYPFRRRVRQGLTESGADAPGFPWVQLAFCVACLAMTAWTWMRYSYCWDIGADQADRSFTKQVWGDGSTWAYRMVRVKGRVTYGQRWDDTMLDDMVRIGLTFPVWEGFVEMPDPERPYRMGIISSRA